MKIKKTALIAACIALSTLAFDARADTAQSRVDLAVYLYELIYAFQGAVVVVIDHGAMHQFFYGSRDASGNPFDHATAVEIGSNTKTFTATALAYVDHYGIMDKDTAIHSWVPVSPTSPPFPATLMDLADHRSGLPRSSGDPTPPGALGPYGDTDLLFASLSACAGWSDPCKTPGKFVYSNYAYQVLGNIISDQLGYPTWWAMTQYLITAPLAMTKTCPHGEGCNPGFSANHAHPFSAGGNELSLPVYDPIGAPAGALWSTADDMATWLRYNLGESTTQDAGPLNALRPELRTSPQGNTGFAWNFKSLTFSDGTASTVRWKDGRYAGLVSYLGVADSRDTAVFVFVNRDPVPSTPDPTDEGPGTVLQLQLGEMILEQFP